MQGSGDLHAEGQVTIIPKALEVESWHLRLGGLPETVGLLAPRPPHLAAPTFRLLLMPVSAIICLVFTKDDL